MPRISEAESRIMQVLWHAAPQSAEDIIDTLADANHWQDKTVRTLLNRLLKKGAVRADRDGRRYLYSPILRREEWVHGESHALLERVFDGRVVPMLAHFTRHERLSTDEIRALRELVDSIDDRGDTEDKQS